MVVAMVWLVVLVMTMQMAELGVVTVLEPK